ncbi:hypothetical protein SAMN05660489_04348 [Pseudomonas sp. LAMO17WK12:I10]|uniref:hypothetical protein n=1 Tax=unclassified Pseudomonas TaxID=196821 RepID=UPI000BCB81D8|nr:MULTISPECIES: hypothetical protein [unclassified Pseudomonas]PXX60727.1 hypothetical protein H160_04403 [Pseudomonas sp. LAMO17WK12:I9]SNY45355.1 hypothetical protein SAMN05660489_04348 [Pseudomonas sp. LAMO17WK12:I10]
MSNPAVIYLGPECEAETGDGRTWAEDWPWPECECGHQPVQYVLGETFNRVTAEREALQQRLNVTDELNDSLRAQLAERDALPLGWEDQLFAEMQRRFELSKRDDNHMVNDDTQIGVEFAIDWIRAAINPTPKPTCCGSSPAGCIGAKP